MAQKVVLRVRVVGALQIEVRHDCRPVVSVQW